MLYPEIIINTDGGSRGNPGPSAIGVVGSLPSGDNLFQFGEYLGTATNNIAEYQAVIKALDYLYQQKITSSKVKFILDSELVVKQLNGLYKVKEETLKVLYLSVKSKTEYLVSQQLIGSFQFTNVRRELNKQADQIVNETLDSHSK